MLDNAALKDMLGKMVTPTAKRQAVAHLVAGHGMRERWAWRLIGSCRMTMRYGAIGQDDPVLRERLKELAKARRRFGYPLPGRALRSNGPRGGGCICP